MRIFLEYLLPLNASKKLPSMFATEKRRRRRRRRRQKNFGPKTLKVDLQNRPNTISRRSREGKTGFIETKKVSLSENVAGDGYDAS